MDMYLELMSKVLRYGERRKDRTGTGTISMFGASIGFHLDKGFPIVTTKYVHFKSVVAELIWFLSGSTNNNDLEAMGSTIWKEWAKPDGSLGPIYGKQWRDFGGNGLFAGIDQISQLIHGLKTDPYSRRHMVTALDPVSVGRASLAPCHTFFQCYVSGDGKLSLHMYQRSADLFLGLPFNIASYALLTHMLAQVCGFKVGNLMISLGDVHIYSNHLDQVKIQLERSPLPLPKLVLNPDVKDIFDFKPEDVKLDNYLKHSALKAPVSV